MKYLLYFVEERIEIKKQSKNEKYFRKFYDCVQVREAIVKKEDGDLLIYNF